MENGLLADEQSGFHWGRGSEQIGSLFLFDQAQIVLKLGGMWSFSGVFKGFEPS